MIAGRESSLTGEIYTRADGKKVRRVKKSSLSSSSSMTGGEEQVEIITRPDGTKVKRIRRVRPKEGSSSSANGPAYDPPSTSDEACSDKSGLSGYLGSSSPSGKKQFSGSHSVAGDKHLEGEIYIRADGKKVRRVRKVKPSSSGPITPDISSGSSSLSGFLDSDTLERVKGGAATVVGDVGGTGRLTDDERPETEIYVRPDGTKVRRIRRTAVKPTENATAGVDKKETLDGFLIRKESTAPRKKVGGSASVAGDQIAVSKESSLTGEVYVRADGKKGKCDLTERRAGV
jgi:hypothetical protein